jgi:hypothetical protein
MSFINVFEELSSLYESEAVEVAADEVTKEEVANEKTIDSGCEEEATEDELNEGIFDSKATKQKAYEKEVNDIFGATSVRLATEISSNITDVIESVANASGEDEGASTTMAKNMIKLLKGAMVDAKGKTPLALVRAVISIGSKYEPNATGLDELKEFASKVSKLSDMKSRQYLMGKVNATVEQRMNHTINFLKKEFGITESLEDVGAEGDAESDVVDEAEVVEPKQLILECSKCGALVIKDESDIELDEEADLVNVNDECAFCEEAAGYTIVGAVAPYEVVEVEDDEETEEGLDEGIFDKFKKNKPDEAQDSEPSSTQDKFVVVRQDQYGNRTVVSRGKLLTMAEAEAKKKDMEKFGGRYEILTVEQAKKEFKDLNDMVDLNEGIFDKFKKNNDSAKTNTSNQTRVSVDALKKGDVIEHPIRPFERVGVEKVELLPSFVRVTFRGGHKQRYDYKDTVKKFK